MTDIEEIAVWFLLRMLSCRIPSIRAVNSTISFVGLIERELHTHKRIYGIPILPSLTSRIVNVRLDVRR